MREVLDGDLRHLDAEIEAVHQRAGDAAEIVRAAIGHAGAGPGGVGEMAAAAGVGGGHQHEFAGIADMGVGAGHDDVAGLDGLAQGLQHGAAEFGQLVEEEHAVMGEADLAGFGRAAAADDGGHRGGVVRGAEGARAGDAALVEQAREGVDHRGLERLGRLQRREDAGQAGGEHGFAAAGRADHQDVVAAGGGDLERAFGLFLAAHVAEIADVCRAGDGAGFGGGDRGAAGEVVDQRQQGFRRDDLDGAHPGGLGAAGGGADQPAIGLRGGHRGGQGADDRDERAVERQFAESHVRCDGVGGQDLHRGENRQRDGQIEMRALLGQVGGREVDGDALGREGEAHRGHRGAHAFLGLGDRLVGQAHEIERGQTGGDGALHLDEAGVHALECDSVGARDHLAPSGRFRATLARQWFRRR